MQLELQMVPSRFQYKDTGKSNIHRYAEDAAKKTPNKPTTTKQKAKNPSKHKVLKQQACMPPTYTQS